MCEPACLLADEFRCCPKRAEKSSRRRDTEAKGRKVRFSMSKMPHASEEHRHAMRIGRGDDLRIFN